ncbi:MAG: hypothetical protein P1V97_01775 [Planctomycetota bacterium]|nr:hypothetical protein [Planctomycetota bacterium]
MTESTKSDDPLRTREAVCILHDDRDAEESCERCGDFICKECIQDLFSRQVCPNCHKNYGGKLLSDFQASLWGKRDVYVWLIGGFGSLLCLTQALVCFAMTIQNLSGANTPLGVPEALALALFLSLALVITSAYFLLKKWARKALFLIPLTGFFLAVVQVSDLANAVAAACLIVPLPVVFLLSAFTNPQNRLAFRIEVSRDELESLFEVKKSNRAAHNALALSLVAFILPPLLFLSLYLALRGRKNCDPEAWPPVGGMKPAQNALILTTLGFLLWTVILLFGGMS